VKAGDKMPTYVLVDSTGEFHDKDCGVCGFLSISGGSEEEINIFKEHNTHDGHLLVQVTYEEKDRLVEIKKSVIRGGTRVEVPYDENINDIEEKKTEEITSKYKIDVNKAKTDLKERAKVDDLSKPIEINGIGGKEVIGYKQKPESIVIERSKTLK
jgi:hypothetical protein